MTDGNAKPERVYSRAAQAALRRVARLTARIAAHQADYEARLDAYEVCRRENVRLSDIAAAAGCTDSAVIQQLSKRQKARDGAMP